MRTSLLSSIDRLRVVERVTSSVRSDSTPNKSRISIGKAVGVDLWQAWLDVRVRRLLAGRFCCGVGEAVG